MLGEVGIQSRTPVHPGGVVRQNFFKRLESSVVHIRWGHCAIAQGRHGEFAAVAFPMSDGGSTDVARCDVQAVVGKVLTLKKRSAMTMKAIGPA